MKRLHLCTLFLLIAAIFSAASDSPKTLLFSPISPEYLEAKAQDFADTGFDGFLINGIMHSWDSDVWAVDGDPETKGLDDRNLQLILRCNRACKKAGIEDNFIKVAFYSHIPDWFDDAGWQQLCSNFRNAAEFARLAGMRGIALDVEYIAEIYKFDWEGYQGKNIDQKAMRAKAEQRGHELVGAMYDVYPDMVFLNLPESVAFYGPLAVDLTMGFLKEAAKRNAPGGMHVLTEGTYQLTDPTGLLSRLAEVNSKMEKYLSADVKKYWREKCSVTIGCWPLGYYREILDDDGNRLGYAGKKEKFGDKIIGSYADKSCNYSPAEFRDQYSFASSFAKPYNWIYGHGCTWWQLTEEEAKKYNAHSNATLPVDENLDQYQKILQEKSPVTNSILSDMAEVYQKTGVVDIVKNFGVIQNWLLLGTFENTEAPGERHSALRKNLIDTSKKNFPDTVETSAGPITWKPVRAEEYCGYVDAMPVFETTENISYFALCYVVSFMDDRPAQLRVSGNDAIAVWLGGQKLFEGNRSTPAALDEDIINIVLPKGITPILLQICQGGGTTGFYARITDDEGNPLPDLQYPRKPD